MRSWPNVLSVFARRDRLRAETAMGEGPAGYALHREDEPDRCGPASNVGAASSVDRWNEGRGRRNSADRVQPRLNTNPNCQHAPPARRSDNMAA
jgi:hypothetical protein